MSRSIRAVLVCLIAGMSVLAACSHRERDAQVSDHPAPGAASEARIFACDDATSVRVRYRATQGPDGGIELEIADETYRLYLVPSGSGSRFATEQGLTPDMLLEWWEKGDAAMMLESPLDDSARPEDAVIRARCRLAGSGSPVSTS